MTATKFNLACIAIALWLLAGCAHPRAAEDALVRTSTTAPGDDDTNEPPPPGSYRIKAIRPMKAGEAYDVRLITTIDMTMTMGEMDPSTPPHVDHNTHESQITGRIDVSSVDERGHPADVTFTVDKFTDSKGVTLLESGRVAEIRRQGTKIQSTLRGGTLDKDAEKALLSFYNSFREGFEGVLASTKPRKPGETWQLMPSQKDVQLPADQIQLNAESISGEATLQSIDTIGGVEAMHLEGAMVIRLKPMNVPFALRLDQSKTTMSARALLPVDVAASPLEVEDGMDMEMTMSGNILFRHVNMAVITRRHMTRKPIAK